MRYKELTIKERLLVSILRTGGKGMFIRDLTRRVYPMDEHGNFIPKSAQVIVARMVVSITNKSRWCGYDFTLTSETFGKLSDPEKLGGKFIRKVKV